MPPRRKRRGRVPSREPPPLPPPPKDAVALYVRWQAAKERLAELQRTLPPVGETAAGGVVIPIHDPRVIEAAGVETEAARAFYLHPWWYGAFSKSEAEQVIKVAARRLTGGL